LHIVIADLLKKMISREPRNKDDFNIPLRQIIMGHMRYRKMQRKGNHCVH
jgi:hypothetical protein